jgi:ferric-dicitrate binding protein FerR (iron transport regulator)
MKMDSDKDLASLLRAAGVRMQPTEKVKNDVREAVEAEWRATCEARQRRQRYTVWSAAAGIAVAAIGIWLARPLYLHADDPVASLARVEGAVQYRSDGGDQWGPLPTAVTLRSGDQLRTTGNGRVALRLLNGVELRLDNSTRITLNDLHHAKLRRGAVYVDSGGGAADASRDLELDTPAGTLRHLGTQYEARVVGDSVLVAVREGQVAVEADGNDAVGRAGEQLVIDEDGRVARKALAANADSWAWVGAITPPFAIEGRSVDDFLRWAARETGRSVTYASEDAARSARGIVLKGSVDGLTPEAAVKAVLSTTPLQPSIKRDRIHIEAATR